MKTYRAGTNLDLGLLNWWTNLVACGDLERLVGSSLHPLAAFMEHFARCPLLHYEEDERGWTVVAWAFPFMYGGTWGCWIRPDKRASRSSLQVLVDSLHAAFEMFPVLVNTTKQDPVVHKTQRLGYTYLGTVPYLFDGEPAHVLYMTKQRFDEHAKRWRFKNG